jgi:hypothetical protein
MQTIYSFTQFFNSVCLAHPNITTFTVGDIYDIDTAKTSLFPLAHLMIDNTIMATGAKMTYNCTLLVMDRITDIAQTSTGHFNQIVKNYRGITNVLDVWNTSQATISDIVVYIMNNAQPYQYNILTDVTITPFTERFDNALSGCGAVMQIEVPYNPSNCLIKISDVQADGGVNPC